jgi:hypothetical protein
MHPLFPHRLSITWKLTVLEVSAAGLVEACCQKCRCPLDVHQPGENQPNHLLGTCSECGSWHMIELSADGLEAYLFNMPGLEFVRAKLAERKRKQQARPAPKARRTRSARLPIGLNGQAD